LRPVLNANTSRNTRCRSGIRGTSSNQGYTKVGRPSSLLIQCRTTRRGGTRQWAQSVCAGKDRSPCWALRERLGACVAGIGVSVSTGGPPCRRDTTSPTLVHRSKKAAADPIGPFRLTTAHPADWADSAACLRLSCASTVAVSAVVIRGNAVNHRLRVLQFHLHIASRRFTKLRS
jgi:hypothetical protein